MRCSHSGGHYDRDARPGHKDHAALRTTLTEVFRRQPHDATVAEAAKITPAAIAAESRAKAIDSEVA